MKNKLIILAATALVSGAVISNASYDWVRDAALRKYIQDECISKFTPQLKYNVDDLINCLKPHEQAFNDAVEEAQSKYENYDKFSNCDQSISNKLEPKEFIAAHIKCFNEAFVPELTKASK